MRLYFLLILCTSFFAISTAQAENRCKNVQLSPPYAAICSDPELRRADKILNDTYESVRRTVPDKQALRTEQRSWLQAVRDRCDDKECLMRVHRERIIELGELLVRSVRISEQPLSNNQAKDTCSSLAALADEKRLAALSLPGKEQWLPDGKAGQAGWNVTDEERNKLNLRKFGFINNEPDLVYKLRLKQSAQPVRFARFFTGGTCASYEVFSIPHLLESNDEDLGVDEVYDPDEMIRWAYWGGGDYPIIYRGRNFMVTADLNDPNHANMISWIKPDGRKRPLCLLAADNVRRTVVSAKNDKLCSGIADGTIRPLVWKAVNDVLPFNHASSEYRDEFVRRYGQYADQVGLLNIDIDADGVSENVAKFEYFSGAGCGSTQTWLSVLSKDLGAVVKNSLNGQLGELGGEPIEIYKFDGNHYAAAGIDDANASVVQIRDGKIEQICELGNETKTNIARFFNLEP